MKTRFLQLRRTLSATLFVLMLNVLGMTGAFGQALVATLQHGENVSVFYGANALVQAHDAAVCGDIITLPSGTFTAHNGIVITKAITLRGSGCILDTITNVEPTIIPYIVVDIPEGDNGFLCEGFYFEYLNIDQLYNSKFIKCNIDNVSSSNGSSDTQNIDFINCIIKDFNCQLGFANFQFFNSVVNLNNAGYRPGVHYENGLSFINSIVFLSTSNTDGILAQNSILLGCLEFNESLFTNCVNIGCYGHNINMFSNQQNSTNLSLEEYSDCFESFNGYDFYWGSSEEFSYSERYILREDFASSFLGTDGTEVGIHGGLAPYNTRPNYMVMKRGNVAVQSTVDGKLSVDIEVVTDGE